LNGSASDPIQLTEQVRQLERERQRLLSTDRTLFCELKAVAGALVRQPLSFLGSEMTRRRFFAQPEAFDFRTRRVSLATDEARHLREVLRLKLGDRVQVFDGEGHEYSAIIEKAMRDTAVLELVDEVQAASPESPLELTLALALLKGDKFDLVVQKATELGVSKLLPVKTKFADVRLRDDSDVEKRVSRWERIALEAAKQSGRAALPHINTPTEFASVITGALDDAGLRVMFAERDGVSLAKLPSNIAPQSVVALVGSEGGWSDEEIDLGRANGWKIVTLGGRILRAETAAITIVALLQHLYGDLR
jgi:16S rRNA (uracil1498-N3)-methyltransferase